VNPHNASTMGGLALYYAKKGDSTQALQFIRRARSIDPNSNQLIYNEAVIQALANHPDEAIKALREAFQKGYSPEEARNDPELKSLEGHPAFEELLKEEMKAPGSAARPPAAAKTRFFASLSWASSKVTPPPSKVTPP